MYNIVNYQLWGFYGVLDGEFEFIEIGATMPAIHWYPGHMAKAKRELGELIKCLDLLIEVRDARIPLASHNRDLEPLLSRRPNLVVLNKTDLAEAAVNQAWETWFTRQGLPVVGVNSRTGQGVKLLWRELDKRRNASTLKRAWRVGVVGIPNVGKSSLLNRLLGAGAAATGNRPGVTRGKQWIKRGAIEVLDTPGLLPPKITDRESGVKLALIGSVGEELLPVDDLALELLARYGERLFDWSKQGTLIETPESGLEWYARKRAFLMKGGELDLNRATHTLLQEFRNGRLGRFSLENPVKDGD
jgi:ribosome biogenesis GTPase A